MAAGDEPLGVAVSPDGGSLYVTNTGDFFDPANDSVSQYDIGAGGAPPKNPPTVATGDRPFGVAVSPLSQPTSKEQCKCGGWRQFDFKNQGQCMRFVKHGPKN